MTRNPAKILSASRRTDIPAFYLDWFMEHIRLGFFDIKNPYTRKTRHLSLSETRIDTIVFWSKNYGSLLDQRAGEKLQEKGYHLFFHFTINSESPVLEPGIPPLEKRLEQLEALAERFGPQSISWRFDPVCFYRQGKDRNIQNNLDDFMKILEKACETGLSKCITSFFDPYRKITRRIKQINQTQKKNIEMILPDMDKKKQVLYHMAGQLAKKQMTLGLCCEKELYQTLDPAEKIEQSACIDGRMLRKIYGGDIDISRDYGQRAKQGCLCSKSIDVGSYDDHPCFHNCLFCYAAPAIDREIQTGN